MPVPYCLSNSPNWTDRICFLYFQVSSLSTAQPSTSPYLNTLLAQLNTAKDTETSSTGTAAAGTAWTLQNTTFSGYFGSSSYYSSQRLADASASASASFYEATSETSPDTALRRLRTVGDTAPIYGAYFGTSSDTSSDAALRRLRTDENGDMHGGMHDGMHDGMHGADGISSAGPRASAPLYGLSSDTSLRTLRTGWRFADAEASLEVVTLRDDDASTTSEDASTTSEEASMMRDSELHSSTGRRLAYSATATTSHEDEEALSAGAQLTAQSGASVYVGATPLGVNGSVPTRYLIGANEVRLPYPT